MDKPLWLLCLICTHVRKTAEKAMAPHSSTLAWKIPWTEEPGGLQSMGSRRVRHDWATHFHFSLSCIGEGNGNPLQCSCLENPRDGGAWWAAVYGVTQSQTRLKQLSSSSSLGGWGRKASLWPRPFLRICWYKWCSCLLPEVPPGCVTLLLWRAFIAFACSQICLFAGICYFNLDFSSALGHVRLPSRKNGVLKW